MRKSILLTGLLALSYNNTLYANEESSIDPGDMTKVYTQVGASIDSDSNIKALGSLSGTYSNSDNFLLYGEAVFGDTHFHDEDYGLDYSNTRLQYFQAKTTSISALPKIGFSADLIHSELPEIPHYGDDMSIISLGTVAMISQEYTGKFMAFPNIAYTKGEMYGEDVDGYMSALYITHRISSNRAYVGLFPEYMSLSGGDIERESFKVKLLLATPITDTGRLWLTSTFEHQESKFTIADSNNDWQNTSRVEMGLKYYL
ncbi:hypothetical protein L4D76_15685 [Photobacterium sagamiensis]|uniref:hypothetical protein n=1 Tax=Photobacterium sagamiensis TaxID=2910241 RepID=UPI003D0B9766